MRKAGQQRKLFSQINRRICRQREILYPAMEKHSEAKEKVLEAYEEHHVAKTAINEIVKVSPSNERWKAKVSVLKELIDHHIEEEEKELFKMAKKALDANEVKQITEKIQQQKKKAMG
jgi:hemerythrin-like domain-containing protein